MKFTVYKDSRAEYRWRLVATNGRTIADSGEGYVSKTGCTDAIAAIKSGASAASIEDTTAAAPVRRW